MPWTLDEGPFSRRWPLQEELYLIWRRCTTWRNRFSPQRNVSFWKERNHKSRQRIVATLPIVWPKEARCIPLLRLPSSLFLQVHLRESCPFSRALELCWSLNNSRERTRQPAELIVHIAGHYRMQILIVCALKNSTQKYRCCSSQSVGRSVGLLKLTGWQQVKRKRATSGKSNDRWLFSLTRRNGRRKVGDESGDKQTSRVRKK